MALFSYQVLWKNSCEGFPKYISNIINIITCVTQYEFSTFITVLILQYNVSARRFLRISTEIHFQNIKIYIKTTIEIVNFTLNNRN